MTEPELDPDAPTPEPWTPEQIAAYNERHDAILPGKEKEWHARRQLAGDRARELRRKGTSRMTPAERDEVLELLLADYVRRNQ